MGTVPWILIAVLALLLFFAAIAILVVKKNKRPTDYYAIFVMGLVWLAAGLPLDNYPLWTMGLVFIIVGLVHRDKWEKNRLRWDKLTPGEKKFKLAAIIFLSVLALAGLVAYYLTSQKIIKL